MFAGFVHPALAFGALLCAVPVIIHLLNRRRHRPVPWAAMRFVMAAYKKTRRRVELENLLLLLLRAAAVALLALAVARPFASGDSPLAALTEKRRDLVLILDASASTGYRQDVETVFERIVARADMLVSELDGTRGDRVRVILASEHPRLISWTSPEKALSVLSTLNEPTDEALDLASALGEALRALEEDASGTGQTAVELRLLSDLQRRSFEPGSRDAMSGVSKDARDERAPLLVEQLDAIAELDAKVLVEDLGPAEAYPSNMAVASLTPLQGTLGAGIPGEIAVRVANHGPSPRPAARVVLEVDGKRQPSQRIDVPASGSAEATFPVQLAGSGSHTLVASLEGDRLTVDDARPMVVSVPPPIRVLLVNGARAPRIEDDETGYLMAVLEPADDAHLPGIGGLSPFDPREVTPDVLVGSELALTDFDVIVLANVRSLPAEVVQRLEERVAAGASLIITLGDVVSVEKYRELLFRADGSGLLPAEFVGRDPIAASGDDYYRIAKFETTHPALAFFDDDLWKPLLTEVPIFQFFPTRPLESARVLASLDDRAASPILIERAYDAGRVFLWTTSIDPAWTRLPESPRTLVPLAHELVRYAGSRRSPERNVPPGAVVTLLTESFPRSPELVRPDGSRRPLEDEPVELPDGHWHLADLRGPDTERVGLYRVDLEGAPAEPFSVQLDASESDLDRLAPAELAGIHPALVAVERGGEDDSGDEAGPRRGELWRTLAIITLAVLVAESLWAAWLGNRRRVTA